MEYSRKWRSRCWGSPPTPRLSGAPAQANGKVCAAPRLGHMLHQPSVGFVGQPRPSTGVAFLFQSQPKPKGAVGTERSPLPMHQGACTWGADGPVDPHPAFLPVEGQCPGASLPEPACPSHPSQREPGCCPRAQWALRPCSSLSHVTPPGNVPEQQAPGLTFPGSPCTHMPPFLPGLPGQLRPSPPSKAGPHGAKSSVGHSRAPRGPWAYPVESHCMSTVTSERPTASRVREQVGNRFAFLKLTYFY